LLFIEITPGHDWRHDGAIGFVALRLKGAALESKGWQTKLAGIPKFASPFGEIDCRSCSRRNFNSACLYGGNEAFVTVQKISFPFERFSSAGLNLSLNACSSIPAEPACPTEQGPQSFLIR
jgi:hypothetical protein